MEKLKQLAAAHIQKGNAAAGSGADAGSHGRDRFAALQGFDGEELPSFSYAPAEYVTQIGEYLLVLPQQLDALGIFESV